jgi:hypothetical protein
LGEIPEHLLPFYLDEAKNIGPREIPLCGLEPKGSADRKGGVIQPRAVQVGAPARSAGDEFRILPSIGAVVEEIMGVVGYDGKIPRLSNLPGQGTAGAEEEGQGGKKHRGTAEETDIFHKKQPPSPLRLRASFLL